MSREIKVRVWYGKHMLYFPDLTEWDWEDYQDFIKACQDGGKPPMEFTGLHDKNGKEMFESDILRTATDKPMVVSWSKKFASFCLNQEGWVFTHWFGESCNPSDCEVLGNIYENPELLK